MQYSRCNHSISDTSQFCTNCGLNLETIAPADEITEVLLGKKSPDYENFPINRLTGSKKKRLYIVLIVVFVLFFYLLIRQFYMTDSSTQIPVVNTNESSRKEADIPSELVGFWMCTSEDKGIKNFILNADGSFQITLLSKQNEEIPIVGTFSVDLPINLIVFEAAPEQFKEITSGKINREQAQTDISVHYVLKSDENNQLEIETYKLKETEYNSNDLTDYIENMFRNNSFTKTYYQSV